MSINPKYPLRQVCDPDFPRGACGFSRTVLLTKSELLSAPAFTRQYVIDNPEEYNEKRRIVLLGYIVSCSCCSSVIRDSLDSDGSLSEEGAQAFIDESSYEPKDLFNVALPNAEDYATIDEVKESL